MFALRAVARRWDEIGDRLQFISWLSYSWTTCSWMNGKMIISCFSKFWTQASFFQNGLVSIPVLNLIPDTSRPLFDGFRSCFVLYGFASRFHFLLHFATRHNPIFLNHGISYWKSMRSAIIFIVWGLLNLKIPSNTAVWIDLHSKTGTCLFCDSQVPGGHF